MMEFYKADGKKSKASGDFNLHQKYNAKDSIATKLIWEEIKSEVFNKNHSWTYKRTMSLLPFIQDMQDEGMTVDGAGMETFGHELEKEKDQFQKELDSLTRSALLKFITPIQEDFQQLLKDRALLKAQKLDTKPLTKVITKQRTLLRQWSRTASAELNDWYFAGTNSDKAAVYFYDILKLPEIKNRKTGKRTLDDKALNKFLVSNSKRKAVPEAKLIQEIRERNKLISTYLFPQLDDDYKFRASWNLRGTPFGRFSSDKLFFRIGYSQQNIPPRVRKYFIADKETDEVINFFIDYDKDQAEWVVVAYESNDPQMIAAVNSPTDTHVFTSNLMSEWSFEDIEAESKLAGKSTDPKELADKRATLKMDSKGLWLPRSMTLRQAGKKANHALNYGMREYTFAEDNELSVKDAKEIVNLYHRAYPGVRTWHSGLEFKLKNKQPLINCFGRYMDFKGPVFGPGSDATFREAYSSMPQSTVVDLVNTAILDIRDKWHDVCIKSQNHDSILVQHKFFKKQSMEENSNRLLTEMLLIKKAFDIPLTVVQSGQEYHIGTSAQIGKNWAEKDTKNKLGLVKCEFTKKDLEKNLRRIL